MRKIIRDSLINYIIRVKTVNSGVEACLWKWIISILKVLNDL